MMRAIAIGILFAIFSILVPKAGAEGTFWNKLIPKGESEFEAVYYGSLENKECYVATKKDGTGSNLLGVYYDQDSIMLVDGVRIISKKGLYDLEPRKRVYFIEGNRIFFEREGYYDIFDKYCLLHVNELPPDVRKKMFGYRGIE